VTLRMLAGVLGAIVALGPATAGAQTTGAAPARAAVSSSDALGDIDVAVAVDSQRDRGASTTYTGWHAGASYRAYRIISVFGEGGGEYHSGSGFSAHQYTYGGGARFEKGDPSIRVRPFAQVFLGTTSDNGRGAASASTNHYPVVAPGGGVDLGVSARLAVRARLDFPLYMTFGDVFKGSRFSIGVSIPYGKR
jgi:hypothetical protein